MPETTQTSNGTPTDEQDSIIVMDIGSKSRKNVKRLRRGRGKLMRRVVDTVDDLKSEGEIAADAQVVIVVVKQKPRKNNWLRW